jgi:hypothetical protein
MARSAQLESQGSSRVTTGRVQWVEVPQPVWARVDVGDRVRRCCCNALIWLVTAGDEERSPEVGPCPTSRKINIYDWLFVCTGGKQGSQGCSQLGPSTSFINLSFPHSPKLFETQHFSINPPSPASPFCAFAPPREPVFCIVSVYSKEPFPRSHSITLDRSPTTRCDST